MRTGPGVLAVVVLLALAGCVPTGEGVTASATPSATPVFASDAEALAAAEKAYTKYLAVSDQIAQDGGKDPERIKQYVSSARLQVELRGSNALEDRQLHSAGQTSFTKPSLEQVTIMRGETAVVFYACWNASQVRVLDLSGSDVTPADRANTRALEIVMITDERRLPLVLESDDPWSGSLSC